MKIGNRFWTSDIHFGHRNIIDYSSRPFADVDEMNEAIIERWNATVKKDDVVVVVGDVALGKIKETLPLVKRLNGYKRLVPGNHDRCWTGHSKYFKAVKDYQDVGFNILPSQVEMYVDFNKVMVSHFPYVGDSHDSDRFENQRPVDTGLPLIHGHVHEKWLENGRQYNVGMDVHDFYPVPDEIIVEWLNGLD